MRQGKGETTSTAKHKDKAPASPPRRQGEQTPPPGRYGGTPRRLDQLGWQRTGSGERARNICDSPAHPGAQGSNGKATGSASNGHGTRMALGVGRGACQWEWQKRRYNGVGKETCTDLPGCTDGTRHCWSEMLDMAMHNTRGIGVQCNGA